MNNNDIEEDIKRCKKIIENNTRIIQVIEETLTSKTEKEELEKDSQAIENILADREMLEIEKEIQEENYENLSADVSNIAKKLDLQEDATIDEIHIAIRILKSKRTDMFKCVEKANKYDRLVERIEENLNKRKQKYNEILNDYGNIDTDVIFNIPNANVRKRLDELSFEIVILQELIKEE